MGAFLISWYVVDSNTVSASVWLLRLLGIETGEEDTQCPDQRDTGTLAETADLLSE